MNIADYLGDWMTVIDKEELNKVLRSLSIKYTKELIEPSANKVFKAFNSCPFSKLQVIFLGQDPYCQKNVATGIAFGNNVKKDSDVSPSLQVLKDSVINYITPTVNVNFDNSLESWSKQGILMLNSALTVEVNKPGSHTMMWRPFISKLLQNLSNSQSALIYVLFGNQAQTFIPYINKNFNVILKEKHPSYYARTETMMPYDIFKEIDIKLKYQYNTTIKWFNYD